MKYKTKFNINDAFVLYVMEQLKKRNKYMNNYDEIINLYNNKISNNILCVLFNDDTNETHLINKYLKNECVSHRSYLNRLTLIFYKNPISIKLLNSLSQTIVVTIRFHITKKYRVNRYVSEFDINLFNIGVYIKRGITIKNIIDHISKHYKIKNNKKIENILSNIKVYHTSVIEKNNELKFIGSMNYSKYTQRTVILFFLKYDYV